VAVVDGGPLAAAAKGLTRALARATLVGGSSLVMGVQGGGVLTVGTRGRCGDRVRPAMGLKGSSGLGFIAEVILT
jgi:hypothetical protein